MQPILNAWSLLAATGALMAFHVGLYTLVGRERKAPYIINSVFGLFLLCLLAAAADVLGVLLSNSWQYGVLIFGAILLFFACVATFYVVYRITIRFIYFIDDAQPKHLPGIRQLRAWRSQSNAPTYSHNPLPISEALKQRIIGVLNKFASDGWEERQELELRSLACANDHQGQGNRLLAELSLIFLAEGHSVQYLTASRHPIELVQYLKRRVDECGEDWLSRARHIVVIDAYTPHFGFIDSIYRVKTCELERLGVAIVRSSRTYAGMHTASSKTFNKIKGLMKKEERHPTLVIYEDCYALTDLESPEQYRIFVRHVLPSERLWDGMFTVFLEAAQSDADWRLLQSYASMQLDLRRKKEGLSARQTTTAEATK
jgi:hypothetical protein